MQTHLTNKSYCYAPFSPCCSLDINQRSMNQALLTLTHCGEHLCNFVSKSVPGLDRHWAATKYCCMTFATMLLTASWPKTNKLLVNLPQEVEVLLSRHNIRQMDRQTSRAKQWVSPLTGRDIITCICWVPEMGLIILLNKNMRKRLYGSPFY